MLRHVRPNILGSVIVVSIIVFNIFVVTEATFSYLGAGLPTSVVSWGGDINIDWTWLWSILPILYLYCQCTGSYGVRFHDYGLCFA